MVQGGRGRINGLDYDPSAQLNVLKLFLKKGT
jgi:hypothetical protein